MTGTAHVAGVEFPLKPRGEAGQWAAAEQVVPGHVPQGGARRVAPARVPVSAATSATEVNPPCLTFRSTAFWASSAGGWRGCSPPLRRHVREYDAVVSHTEVNDRHGVGVVLRMLYGGRPDILCIRSHDFFGGDNQLGDRHVRIAHEEGATASRVFTTVAGAMSGMRPRRILCSPYYPADVWNGLVMKYLYGVPLCMYIMDDQSVTTDAIPARSWPRRSRPPTCDWRFRRRWPTRTNRSTGRSSGSCRRW